MSVDAKYRTIAAATGGGRDGRTALVEGTMSLDLAFLKDVIDGINELLA
jgi:hypothetical protein